MKALATTILALITAMAGLVLAAAAPAAEPPSAPLGSEGSEPVMAVSVVDGISFLNGGASIAQADYIKSRGAEFPLQFIFSGRGGEYGVAEKLTLHNGNQQVVSIPDAGPFVWMKVPAGSYIAQATFKGMVEKRTVVVGPGVSKVNWNTPRASDGN